MQRVIGEVKLWRREAIVELLRDALAMVEEVAPPDDLRSDVFERASILLANKNVQLEDVQLTPPAMHVPRG